MQLQILEIILWRRGGEDTRRLRFEPGVVNVITGASRTGKSAVIPIIDYCLGSDSCSIPVDTIRNACSWFGVLIQTDSEQILLARREPGAQKSTGDMMMLRANIIDDIPASAFQNTNVDAVKRVLGEIAGLTTLDTSAQGDGSGFEGRPSFRDMAAFNFQPQNVIANPEVLFYKTSIFEHREKLRKIFPYVLGAITSDLLAKQHEVERLRARLKRLERELQTARDVSARWEAELSARYSEALEFGLIVRPSTAITREKMIQDLQELTEISNPIPNVSSQSIQGAVDELQELEGEESSLSQDLTILRRRLSEMQRALKNVGDFTAAKSVQRDRLNISNWLSIQPMAGKECPMCGSTMSEVATALAELTEAARRFEESAVLGENVPAAFDRELARVRKELTQTTEQLSSVQMRKDGLAKRSTERQQEQYRVRSIERFIGNVENALALQRSLGEDGELSDQVESLRREVEILSAELRRANVDERLKNALRQVNLLAGRLLPSLDTEFPNAPVSLRNNDLTITVTRQDREDFLAEIGSGSNWLSYHLAVMLALHQFFLTLTHSSVPTFLVLDQPSQVYFPKRLTSTGDQDMEAPLRDEDVEAVQKAYYVLAEVTQSLHREFQVIVLDHVSENVWGGIENVHKVEEWRNGIKLVPGDWLATDTALGTS